MAASGDARGAETTSRVSTGRQIAGTAAIRTVELALELAGGRGFFRSMGLEKLFRDIQAGSAIESAHVIGDLIARGELTKTPVPRLRVILTHLQAYERQRR